MSCSQVLLGCWDRPRGVLQGWAGGQPGPNVPTAMVAPPLPPAGEHGAVPGAGAWASLLHTVDEATPPG